MSQSQPFFTVPVIERPLPNAVTYDLSEPHQVTITLPAGSAWSSGLHWHEDHVEYLRIVKGRVRVRLGGTTRILGGGGAEVRVGRNVWHEWSRADPSGEEVVVVERTDPEDGQKAVFFWNLNGVILRAGRTAAPPYVPKSLHGMLMDWWVTLSLFVIFEYLDNVPVLLDVPGAAARWGVQAGEGSVVGNVASAVDRAWSHAVLILAGLFGWLLGIKPLREEFTPKDVVQRWKTGKKTA